MHAVSIWETIAQGHTSNTFARLWKAPGQEVAAPGVQCNEIAIVCFVMVVPGAIGLALQISQWVRPSMGGCLTCEDLKLLAGRGPG
jgi:hypothetical protein